MKHLFYLITILMGFTACYPTYPGTSFDLSGDDIIADLVGSDTVVPVRKDTISVVLSLLDPSFTQLTRAMGAFDLERPDSIRSMMWDNARFKVFALPALANAANRDTYFIYGKIAKVYDQDALMMNFVQQTDDSLAFESEPTIERVYYPTDNPNQPLNFYAYYADDALEDEYLLSGHELQIPITISGSQDLLVGKAKLTEKQYEGVWKNAETTSSEKRAILDASFSTYSARNGIVPKLDMSHQLARLKFEVYPGDKKCEHIAISKVQVLAFPSAVIHIVNDSVDAQPYTTFGGQMEYMELLEANNDTIDAEDYNLSFPDEYLEKDVYDRPHVNVGESLMLPPAQEYHVKVSFLSDVKTGNIKTYSQDVVVNYPLGFQAGAVYTVRIIIYGEEEMILEAVLAGWQGGGDVIWDE